MDDTKLYYEDCGVRGGRISYKDGTEFILSSNSSVQSFGIMQLFQLRDYWQNHKRYCCKRLCVCIITLNRKACYYYFEGDDFDNGAYTMQEEDIDSYSLPYDSIGSFLIYYGAQAYEIFQQTSEYTLRSLYHHAEMDGEPFGNAYDLFRCKDMFGPCNAAMYESWPDFHDYRKYALGQEFYVEAYDDPITKRTEFWIGRSFCTEKYLFAAYDTEDKDYAGLFDESGRLVIDPHIAGLMCLLTDKHEYLFINNEYNLTMSALDMGDHLFDEEPNG